MRCVGWMAVWAMAGAVGFAQNLPAGTHSVDDHSREVTVNAQIAAAEDAIEQGDFKGAGGEAEAAGGGTSARSARAV